MSFNGPSSHVPRIHRGFSSQQHHRRLNARDIARKGTFLFIICGFFLLGVVLYYAQWISRVAVAEAVKGELRQVALALADEVDAVLREELRQISAVARDSRVREFVRQKNRLYGDRPIPRIAELLRGKNEKFIRAPVDSPLVRGVLENPLSAWLRRWREAEKDEVVEVLVTDRHGAVIAATNRPSAFYRARERWWRQAYSRGRGDLFVGDSSAVGRRAARGIVLASPVLDEDERVMGVIRVAVSPARLFRPIGVAEIGRTGRAYLLSEDGSSVIVGPSRGAVVPGEGPDAPSFVAVRKDRKDLLSAVARVRLSEQFGPDVFGGTGWVVYVEKELREVVSHLRSYSLRVLGVGVLALLILSVHFYGTTRIMLSRRLGRRVLRAVWRYAILGGVLFLLAWVFFGLVPKRRTDVEELFRAQSRIYRPKDQERQVPSLRERLERMGP